MVLVFGGDKVGTFRGALEVGPTASLSDWASIFRVPVIVFSCRPPLQYQRWQFLRSVSQAENPTFRLLLVLSVFVTRVGIRRG